MKDIDYIDMTFHLLEADTKNTHIQFTLDENYIIFDCGASIMLSNNIITFP